MEFKSNPANFFHDKHDYLSSRYEKGYYKQMSKTSCYSSILTAGLWRLFGDHIAYNDSIQIFDKLLSSGINHFDLGNNYGRKPGSAELNFGRALKPIFHLRDELIISSKAGYEMMPGPNGSGSSLKHLKSQIEASLNRLDIKYLDIFYTHRYDPNCDLEVLANNLEYLYEKGYFLYAGISSYPPDALIKLIKFLNQRKVPIAALQYNISLLSLSNFNVCRECFLEWGISTIAFSPLNQGILTDSFFKCNKENLSRSKENFSTVHIKNESLETGLKYLNSIAKSNSISIEMLSMSWLISQDFICSLAYGPRKISQIFEMQELYNLSSKVSSMLEEKKLRNFSIKSLDQWKVRDTNSEYNII
tara:strand:+ start:203 stop:1282 length:1080 start_codon:yes stop_codon:yes gene_type:complete